MEYRKIKSVAKQIVPRSDYLSSNVLKTMKTISDIVGATLGPGGRSVLIERYEHDLPPIITKDGVSVMRSLGFEDPGQHCIYEAARDAAVNTAIEAGDGTTTASILSEAIVRYIHAYCTSNPRQTPQKVVRKLESVFNEQIRPLIKDLSIPCNLADDAGYSILKSVASVSANGETPLANAVMECFEIVGDAGNVTITEMSGPSTYEVEEIKGYPVTVGYDECCAKFYPKFVNDPGTQHCRMNNPVFVLYHGTLTETQTIWPLLQKVGEAFNRAIEGRGKEEDRYHHYNVVVVGVGFSETVLATFAAGWEIPNAIKIFPLVIPKSIMPNFQTQFLQDLSAITGANILDPINKPLEFATLEDLGPGVTSFEAGRLRSNIIGYAEGLDPFSKDGIQPYEDRLLIQVDVVESQLKAPESQLDRILLEERLAKLTGGIAKLKVIGSSNGELKEKRDRAEDAVCAVRGAIKHGCLPGGGWALMKICSVLSSDDPVVAQVLKPALMEPVYRLLTNAGFTEDDGQKVLNPVLQGIRDGKTVVYDIMGNRHGDPVELGILDSTPAVLEAIKNSISIASLLGTLGGYCVFSRDNTLERKEAQDVQHWNRMEHTNPADERP